MLAPVFPMNIIEQEVSTQRWIDIPDEVLQLLALWRPAPLYRARRLEKALGTPAKMASPAVVEKLSKEAAIEVKRLAYTPQTGYTLADINSKKPAVKVQPASQTFAAAAEALSAPQEEEW